MSNFTDDFKITIVPRDKRSAVPIGDHCHVSLYLSVQEPEQTLMYDLVDDDNDEEMPPLANSTPEGFLSASINPVIFGPENALLLRRMNAIGEAAELIEKTNILTNYTNRTRRTREYFQGKGFKALMDNMIGWLSKIPVQAKIVNKETWKKMLSFEENENMGECFTQMILTLSRLSAKPIKFDVGFMSHSITGRVCLCLNLLCADNIPLEDDNHLHLLTFGGADWIREQA